MVLIYFSHLTLADHNGIHDHGNQFDTVCASLARHYGAEILIHASSKSVEPTSFVAFLDAYGLLLYALPILWVIYATACVRINHGRRTVRKWGTRGGCHYRGHHFHLFCHCDYVAKHMNMRRIPATV
jgi:hypothetical protein